jgi:hypothetical protein
LKRLSTGILTVLMAAGLGFNAVAAQPGASHGNIGTNAVAQGGGAMAAPPANFGSPPSGQYPILFNDHHVYAKPDVLKQGRVLAALVRGGTLLIPLRSMFEQMGATVSYDAGSKTVTVSKAGAEVKVTVGKPEVVINGESRPLDVPPIIYQGTVLVPVRVISEGMGAYVQWVPDRRLVVVRYIPPTPPPTPAPPPPPPPPPPTPTPVPSVAPYFDRYVAGDYIISPKVYNEFVNGASSNNNNGGFSYRLHGAVEIPVMNLPFMVEVDYRQWNWQHPCGGANCYVTTIGSLGQSYVPAFIGRDYDFDARIGIRVLKPRIYVVGGYLWRGNNYGYPHEDGAGVGLEKLPDLDRVFSFYGSVLYYFDVNGSYSSTPLACGNGPTGASCSYTVGYNMLKYDLGVSYTFPGFPLFIEAGFLGDRGWNYDAAPVGFSEYGPYAGIGLKL